MMEAMAEPSSVPDGEKTKECDAEAICALFR